MATAMERQNRITPLDAPSGVLIITRRDVSQLLTLDSCISVVEAAFGAHGNGTAPAPAVLGVHAESGGFHIKAAMLHLDRPYFAAKTNANFPDNRARRGLPTIQGMIALFDASCGTPLALMDSIEITRLRTGAASAIAAKYLAKKDVHAIAVLGCGDQAPVQLDAIFHVRQPRQVYLFDKNREQAERLLQRVGRNRSVDIHIAASAEQALGESDICVTCTSSEHCIVEQGWIRPGTFIAAVGADSEDKIEIDPQLMASSKVVVDILDQCAAIGDLHHAVKAGLMTVADVHAELGEIVTGRKPGRIDDQEIIVFDSTGTALQDVAAAATVYQHALDSGAGTMIRLNDAGPEIGECR